MGRIKRFFRKIWEGLQDIAERAHQQKLEEGCVFCGGKPICETCYRCFDRSCNAGCIFCNPKSFEVRKCPCCGKAL